MTDAELKAARSRLPVVVATQVTKSYSMGSENITPLKAVDLTVSRGEFLALAGSSGSGKTTFLNLIGGIDVPSSGTIQVDGIGLGDLKADQLARFRAHKIGFIFQTFNLIPTLNALENVEYPLVLLGMPARERRQAALESLQRVGLEKHLKHRPGQMSGGQRQRVAIARAMVKNPLLVLADEPTANLDAKTANEILDLMGVLNQTLGTTFVFSTHDLRILERASRIFKVGAEAA
jgi:putative ABC transport system ATP-binding protein